MGYLVIPCCAVRGQLARHQNTDLRLQGPRRKNGLSESEVPEATNLWFVGFLSEYHVLYTKYHAPYTIYDMLDDIYIYIQIRYYMADIMYFLRSICLCI